MPAYTFPMATILIVDDNEQNLYMLRVLLETNGYRVSSAAQGAEALALARSSPPALVISDILMPVMDGFALCRAWKADPELKAIPLVFYTATYTDVRDEEFALSLGADRFVVKPQDPDRILALVKELTEAPPPVSVSDFEAADIEFLRRHNVSLFHKLEKKVADLDAARAALERDFALRRDLERQLLQIQKMESLSHVAGGIAHDMNNVLTVIGGFASLIRLRKPEDKAQLEEWAQKIQDAVRMGSGLSHQLMAFARTQNLSLSLLAIDDLLAQTLPLVQSTLPAGIDLVFRPSGNLPLVRGDIAQLERVLINLVTNARDAMNPPGTLVVDTAWMDLDEEFVRHRGEGQPGRYVRVRFQDTGTGIAPEILGKIFDPFFTTKKEGQGTGLGLSVAYGIVHQHRGFFQVSTVPGRGTCFEIYLPAFEGK